jgi:gluconate 2-dehydrogenase gamma chain
MSDIGRRQILAGIAAAALAGQVDAQSAQHVHEETAKDVALGSGVYKPKALTPHEFSTLKTLCEIIVPGASKGGAAEFIDILSSQNAELMAIYTGGLAWMDEKMKSEAAADFLSAKDAQRKALLDRIAYRRNDSPELAPGIRFFVWARRMTVDAYYTSPAGIQEVGFMGNKGQTEFKVPQEAVDYAMKRSLME